MIPMPYVIVN